MTVSRRAICISYGSIALVAAVCTWGNVLGLLEVHGFWGGTLKFWQDVLVNESTRFITADILFFMLAVFLWMILEARRLHIPGVWIYIVVAALIGPSILFPLFMIHREFRLAKQLPANSGGALSWPDIIGLVGVGVVVTAYTVRALTL